ncbi:MAG: hypothetical protein HY059_22685 [Proteobacteria bacterium]|nr:hypothetical protein [Pseudomonadota bacterium]
MSRTRLRPLAVAAALCAFLYAGTGCESSSSSKSSGGGGDGGHVSGGGGGGPKAGGGGDVAIGGGAPPTQQSLEGRYQRALGLMKDKNLDAAYGELRELSTTAGGEIAKNAKKQLEQVNTLLYNQPQTPLPNVLSASGDYIEKIVSIKGTYAPGGQTGEAAEYFWIKSDGKVTQANYTHLPLEDKKRILAIPDGSGIVVRGRIKPPWSNRSKPYIDLIVFWVLGK